MQKIEILKKNFNEFSCIYLGEGRGHLREHIVSLCYRTTWWILMKLGMDEELKAPCMFLGILAISAQDGSRAKKGYGGFLKSFSLRADGYNNKTNA